MIEGWRLVGEDAYTCVPPVGYEKDPKITAAIRSFDPGVVPIWRIQVWIAPGDTRPKQYVHHGGARYYPHPKRMRRAFACPVPPDWRGPAPNFLDFILEDQETLDFKRGGPGGFVPWDWATYAWARRQFDRLTVAVWLKALELRKERDAKIRAAHQEELAYRKRQIEPWLIKKLSEVSTPEWEQYLGMMREREAKRRMGLDPGRIREKKLFVDVGRSPRSRETYGRVAPSQELKA